MLSALEFFFILDDFLTCFKPFLVIPLMEL